MQVLKASDLFQNIKNIDNSEFEKSSNITLDFSNINNIDLKGIKILLDLQKVALLNNKALSIKNVNSDVSRMLDVTGLSKTFANMTVTPIRKRVE